MTIWSWIHFISFVIYVLLFAYILGRSPKTYLNWLAAFLMGCFAFWSFGNTMVLNNFSTIDTSKIFSKIGAFGWIFFNFFYLLFILEFTENKKLSRSPYLLFVLFLTPFVLYIAYLAGEIAYCCDKTNFGYVIRWVDTIWTKLLHVYYSSFFLIGIYFLFKYASKETDTKKKKTAILLMTIMFFCFISGIISSVILRAIRQYVPIEANIYVLLFAAGIIYAMMKYDFLSVTPIKAADLIIKTMSDALILLNKDGEVVEVNKAAFDIFECDKREECDRVLPEYLLKKILVGVESEGVLINEEIIITTLKDNKKILLLSASALKDKKELLGYVCLLKDITELKLAKNELNEIILKLSNSNKELEQFAYVISHDLKEPLRMVATYVQMLQKRYRDKLDSDANDFINFAVDGAKRMNDLINALLDYSRVLTKEMIQEDVDIKQIIEEVLSVLKLKIEEKKASVTIKSDMPVVKANKINIARIFQNLIDNALKFCSEKPLIEISSEKKEGFYVFCIKDNGIGINKENKDRVFEIFQRITPREKYEGTGIGLSICKKIIEKHKGKIWVESEGFGKGSSFYFTLPA